MQREFLDDYRLLGLRPGAGWDELRAAYRERIRTWHPDRLQNRHHRAEAEDRSKAINQAYRRLATYYRGHGRLPLAAALAREDAVDHIAANAQETHEPADQRPDSGRLRSVLQQRGAIWTLIGIVLLTPYLAALFVPAPERASIPAAAPVERGAGPDGEPADAPTPEEHYFTVGSRLGEVIAVQGVPTRTEQDIWHYHTSRVYFRDGAVTHWESTSDHPLKARGDLDPLHAAGGYFARGSTKAEVRAIQGEPAHQTDNTWDYGVSRVFFENDRVVGWSESPVNPLRIHR